MDYFQDLETYEGRIEAIIYRNEGNGYTVALFEVEDSENPMEFSIVGHIPMAEEGGFYQIRGRWKTHQSYGDQLEVVTCNLVEPKGAAAIQEFLATGFVKGIGEKTAALIVSRFGDETFEILRETPERLTEIPGIGNKKAEAIGQAFQEKIGIIKVTMALQEYGIAASYAIKLYSAYGAATLDIVQNNPYQLADEVRGIGFKRADQIAERVGMDRESPERIRSGILYLLRFFGGSGHTCYPEKELVETAIRLLDVGSQLIREELETMAFQGDVKIDLVDEVSVVYLMTYYMAEQSVCRKLLQLRDAELRMLSKDIDGLIDAAQGESGIRLSDNQIHGVKASLLKGVSIVTGGPGTGKTTIINTIMKVLSYSGLKTAIAAPTGRAAKRITETSGHPASTLHRLLEYAYSTDEDVMQFGKNSGDPLELDALIVDEASMIDLLLMNALMNALTPGTRVIFVGDGDQLPPVGAGNVFRDMIKSQAVDTIRLTEIFRQAEESQIVVNAHMINRGEYPDVNRKDKDFFFIRQPSEEGIIATMMGLIKTRLPGYYQDLDPIRDIQVITASRKGALGCVELNKRIQQELNPPVKGQPEQKYGDLVYRPGDKVMQIKNNYDTEWRNLQNGLEGKGVFNGDVGYVKRVDKENQCLVVVFDETREVIYQLQNLEELDLAYAVTVHKSQGSEFPVVIMPMGFIPLPLATRNLLYTGITRGKTAVVLVGSYERVCQMVDNNQVDRKFTGLAQRLSRAEVVNFDFFR